MTGREVCFTPATTLVRLFRDKKVSPLEVARAVLARIDSVNPTLNVFGTISAEGALRTARAAERALMRGAPLGPLHGVPVSIKDLTETREIRTTWGLKIYEHHVPTADALDVSTRRLRRGPRLTHGADVEAINPYLRPGGGQGAGARVGVMIDSDILGRSGECRVREGRRPSRDQTLDRRCSRIQARKARVALRRPSASPCSTKAESTRAVRNENARLVGDSS